jgi:hypothetical protein
MLTLRYDPTTQIDSPVPKIPADKVESKRSNTYPSSKEVEKEIRLIINKSISRFDPKRISSHLVQVLILI